MFRILKVLVCVLIVVTIRFTYTYRYRNNSDIRTDYNTILKDITGKNYTDIPEKLINLKDFTFLVNPQVCNPNGHLLMVIVSSKPTHYYRRMIIRDTWGRNEDSTKVVFLIAETNNHIVNRVIQHEIITYGDIVKGNFVDAYRNMTYKHVMGLKWVYNYCAGAKYVLKADDDVVVNTPELRRFLRRGLSPFGAGDLILCQTLRGIKVQRSGTKWAVTVDEYKHKVYPTFCAGFAVLYSQDVVGKLLRAAQSLPYFWIDDIHITGVCSRLAGVRPTDQQELLNSAWKPKDDFYTYNVNPSQMLYDWWCRFSKRCFIKQGKVYIRKMKLVKLLKRYQKPGNHS